MTQPTFTYRVRTRPVPAAPKQLPQGHLVSPSADGHADPDAPPETQADGTEEMPVAATDYARSRAKGDYVVGYGRPPVATRFQKGQRANPKGRPKGVKNARTLLLEKLATKVSVREGGRETRISKFEMGATRLANRFAETGDVKIYMTIDKVIEQTSPATGAGSQDRSDPPEALSATNKSILEWYVARVTQTDAQSQSDACQAASQIDGDL